MGAQMDRITIPIYDATAPIACSLGDDELDDRIALLEQLRRAVARAERTPHGLLLRFGASDRVEADVRRFAADEKRCCTFWGFAVDRGDDEVTLRWDAPPAAAEIIDAIAAWLEGDGDLTAIRSLL